jgi:two-component system chemotaxis sensor kinase CheA
VFNDEVEMKRAVDDLAKNGEVTDAEIWSTERAEGGQKLLVSARRGSSASLAPPRGTGRDLVRADGHVQITAPVVAPDGTVVAMLQTRFSTAREVEALSRLSGQILYAAAGIAVCLVTALLLVLRKVVVAPIRRLQQATQSLARGELGATSFGLEHGRFEDEVVRLATAFRDMASAVQDREERLEVRNSELRLILDSVQQGFFTVRRDGGILPERSAIVETWLGALPAELTVWELVELISADMRAWTEMAWSQVMEGMLPLDVALEQLPRRLRQGDRHFLLEYHPVLKADEVERVVVVLSDVTAEVERQRARAEQHEFSLLVDRFVRDRRAFFDFWNEANGLIDRVLDASHTGEALRRDVHTVKGNARFFGLTRLSETCHAIEDGMQERGELTLSEAERQELAGMWGALRSRVELLISGAKGFVEVHETEYERFLQLIKDHAPYGQLEEFVLSLRQETAEWRLRRAKEALLGACDRLGKPKPRVLLEHNDVRALPGRLASFWSVLGHVLNNAADHGIEGEVERKAVGKASRALVRLSTRLAGDQLIVEVSDDGRGIDWERVRSQAERRGLPAHGERELMNALLSDGFSLKSDVSETSGRGVGLSAVRSAVATLGGRIEVESRPGEGTTWRFFLPNTARREDSSGAARSAVSRAVATTGDLETA